MTVSSRLPEVSACIIPPPPGACRRKEDQTISSINQFALCKEASKEKFQSIKYKLYFFIIFLLFASHPDHKRKTKCVPRTLNPEWKRTLVFLKVPQSELPLLTVEVSVWDHDRFLPDQLLGEVLFDLSGN